jgi:hypothetical protein
MEVDIRICTACETREATSDGRFCSVSCGYPAVYGGAIVEARRRAVQANPEDPELGWRAIDADQRSG